MRIAFVVGNFPALSETFILNQITGLIDRGHEIDIFAEKARNDPSIHADVATYNLLERTYYWNAPLDEKEQLFKALGLLALNFYKKSGALLKIVRSTSPKKYRVSLKTFYQAIPFLDKQAYDIIYCHFGIIGNIAARLKKFGVVEGKLITTFHGLDLSMVVQAKGNKVYQELFKLGDLFLPISHVWEDKLKELGCEQKKILVHRMGIDISKFKFCKRTLKATTEKIKLLTIARLTEKKGIEYSIRAVAKVIQTHKNLSYKIIGDGELREPLEKLICDLKIGDRVEILGWKKQEEVIKIMEESDIFLAPSVTAKNGDREGIPVVLMEALAIGMPVISTLHSGIPELVLDGQSGFLVPEKDADVLAQKLQYLLENKSLWRSLGQYGREFVEQHYDINKLNDRLVQIYQQVLE
jgi:colanic acid/amylovoran biosynthesis glycosyltransferase